MVFCVLFVGIKNDKCINDFASCLRRNERTCRFYVSYYTHPHSDLFLKTQCTSNGEKSVFDAPSVLEHITTSEF